MLYDIAHAIDNVKLPWRNRSSARWEGRTSIATAVSSVVVENHGGEFGVHGDDVVFCLRENFEIGCAVVCKVRT